MALGPWLRFWPPLKVADWLGLCVCVCDAFAPVEPGALPPSGFVDRD